MSVKYFIPTLVVSACLLSGCSTIHQVSDQTKAFISNNKVSKTAQQQYAQTDPKLVILTNNDHLRHSYEKIGSVTINNYNLVGVKRQKGVINDLMQKYAAKMGGNAVINIHTDSNKKVGEIVRFI